MPTPIELDKTLFASGTFSGIVATNQGDVENRSMYPSVALKMNVSYRSDTCPINEETIQGNTCPSDEETTEGKKVEEKPSEIAAPNNSDKEAKKEDDDKSNNLTEEQPSGGGEPKPSGNHHNNNGSVLDEARFANKLKFLSDNKQTKRKDLVQTRLICSSRSLSSNDLLEKLAQAEKEGETKEEESTEVPKHIEIRCEERPIRIE